MSARDHILGRLRAATATATVADIPQWPDVGQWYATRHRNETQAQRAVRLCNALQAVQTEVHDTTATGWPKLLLEIAQAKGLQNLLIGTDTPHGAALGACQRQLNQLNKFSDLSLIYYEQCIESWRDTLFEGVDAALTGARGAIAETGSLILWPSASEPRLMSLVPPIHFVLLDVTTIHADFHAALGAEGWKDQMPTNALLVCGPSKTADIQQTLAYGAHGPRELVVLLCHPEGEKA